MAKSLSYNFSTNLKIWNFKKVIFKIKNSTYENENDQCWLGQVPQGLGDDGGWVDGDATRVARHQVSIQGCQEAESLI